MHGNLTVCIVMAGFCSFGQVFPQDHGKSMYSDTPGEGNRMTDRESIMTAEPALEGMEYFLYRDENYEIPVETLEEWQERCRNPVNLNMATREDLERSGLFTPYQVRTILDYRSSYGDFYSLCELGSLPGFSGSHLKELISFIAVEGTPEIPHGRIRGNHNGKVQMLFYAGRTLPDASGYLATGTGEDGPRYQGSPLAVGLKIRAEPAGRIRLGLAYEKDPGEKGFRNYRPEFLSGYLACSGHRILDQLIVGTFTLHAGLGLVQGTGMFHFTGSGHPAPLSLSVLKPYAGTGESIPQRGLAVRLNTGSVRTLAWISVLPMDLSPDGVIQDSTRHDWVSFRRESGLHRTTSEMNGRSLGYLADAGIQVLVNHRYFDAGALISSEVSGLTDRAADSLGIPNETFMHSSASIFWHWRRKQIETYGEVSPGSWNRSAIQAGFNWNISEFISGCLQIYHYGTGFRDTYSSTYTTGGHVSNSQGILLLLHAEPYGKLLADFSMELNGHPSPRYQCAVPSSGARFSAALYQAGTGYFLWKVRWVHRIWQDSPESDQNGIRPVAASHQTRIDSRFIYQSGSLFRWQSRFIASLPGESQVRGFAAVQQAELSLKKYLKCTLQFVVFNVPEWDGRIYIYEPGLYQQFDFPVYYGQGQKIAAVLSLKPGSGMTLECKATMAVYHDRDRLGSGNDLVEGSEKYSLGIQFRLNL
jgi:hypothetical protein